MVFYLAVARQMYKRFKRFNSHEEVTLRFATEQIYFKMYLTFTILQCFPSNIMRLLLEFYIVFSLLLHEKINDAVTFKCLKQTI